MGLKNTLICVLTNYRKKTVTLGHLHDRGCPLILTYENPDWPVPTDQKDWHEHHTKFTSNTTADYRCFKGHTEIAKNLLEFPNPQFLVLEDDAKPTDGWQKIVEDATELLSQYEVVSLHSRAVRVKNEFDYKGQRYVQPGPNSDWCPEIKWANGTLAYLIRRDALSRLAETQYTGVPIDLWLPNHFIFCCIQPDEICFIHQNVYGSFHDQVSNTKPIE